MTVEELIKKLNRIKNKNKRIVVFDANRQSYTQAIASNNTKYSFEILAL